MAEETEKDVIETDEAGDEAKDEATDEVEFIEAPVYEVNYKGDCEYEVKVSIPVASERHEAAKMLDELRRETQLPGFRKGRAPRPLVERKFGKALRGEVATKLVNAAFRKLIKDDKLKPITQPAVEGLEGAGERKENEPITCTLKFAVAPRVQLGKYRGIEVERPVVTIDDRDIDQQIDDLRARYAVFDTLEGGVAAEGDQVVIDFEGTVDGAPFPGGSAKSYPYILGTKRFFPEFEEVLRGASAGDELNCTVTLPQTVSKEELRGKKARFTIKVKEIKRRQAPALTDAFAKQVGCDNIAALREKVAENLRTGSEAQSNRMADAAALDAVIAASTFEIPKAMIDAAAQHAHDEEVKRLMSERVPVKQIEERDEEIMTRCREAAIYGIKRMVVLGEIAEVEGIEVTEDDFNEQMELLAQRFGLQTEVLTKQLQEGDRRSEYEQRILYAKAIKVIMDNARIIDKEVPREELAEEDSATKS